MLGLYPDTTSFYQATVIAAPIPGTGMGPKATGGRADPGAKKGKYVLSFVDDGNSEQDVDALDVVPVSLITVSIHHTLPVHRVIMDLGLRSRQLVHGRTMGLMCMSSFPWIEDIPYYARCLPWTRRLPACTIGSDVPGMYTVTGAEITPPGAGLKSASFDPSQ